MKWMNFIFGSFFFLILMVSCESTPVDQTIYLVRHAEKDTTDKTDNPPLIEDGYARANRLVEFLDTVAFSKVYSTKFDRNINTVKPLMDAKNIELGIYEWYDWENELDVLMKKEGNFLICGHGDNLLPMIEYLGASKPIEKIGHNEYDNLFKVIRKKGNIEVVVIKF